MNLANFRPKPAPSGAGTAFGSAVDAGSFVRFDDASAVPLGLAHHPGERFLTAVVAAISVDPTDWAYGTRNAPAGTLYMVKIFRSDAHDGTPHFNEDASLYWADNEGNDWQIHCKENPDHYRTAVAGTGLQNLSGEYCFPTAYSGSIEQFGEKGGTMDFHAVAPGLIKAAGEK